MSVAHEATRSTDIILTEAKVDKEVSKELEEVLREGFEEVGEPPVEALHPRK